MLTVLSVAVGVAYHIVSALAQLLAPVTGGLATAAAIVLFTMAVRLLLLPLSYFAIRGQARQGRVAAQAQALRERHARQPDRLSRELAALYQREGAGMAAGCLPVLLQLPFLSVMYTLFRSGTIAGHANGLLGHDLFAAPLGSHWLSGPGPLSGQGAVFLALFALLAAGSWLAARAARKSAAAQPRTAALARSRPGQPGRAERRPGQADGALAVLTKVMPYATLGVAAVMPLAAGLYLLTTTMCAAAERVVLGRRSRGGPDLDHQGG
jgi:YidC/Oxa1 family membrane protein insertase